MFFISKSEKEFKVRIEDWKEIISNSKTIKDLVDDYEYQDLENIVIPLPHREETVQLYTHEYKKHMFRPYSKSKDLTFNEYIDHCYSFYLSLTFQQLLDLMLLAFDLEDEYFLIPLMVYEMDTYKDSRVKTIEGLHHDFLLEFYSHFIRNEKGNVIHDRIPSFLKRDSLFVSLWVRNVYIYNFLKTNEDFDDYYLYTKISDPVRLNKSLGLFLIAQLLEGQNKTIVELIMNYPYVKSLIPNFVHEVSNSFIKTLLEKKVIVNGT